VNSEGARKKKNAASHEVRRERKIERSLRRARAGTQRIVLQKIGGRGKKGLHSLAKGERGKDRGGATHLAGEGGADMRGPINLRGRMGCEGKKVGKVTRSV